MLYFERLAVFCFIKKPNLVGRFLLCFNFEKHVQILNDNSAFRIYDSYLAKSRSLILSRSFDFAENILLNFFKDNGETMKK